MTDLMSTFEPVSRTACALGVAPVSAFHAWSEGEDAPAGRQAAVDGLAALAHNLTGKSLQHVRGALDRAWAHALSLRVEEARELGASIEPWLGDLPAAAGDEARRELQLLQASAFALGDHTEPSLALAEALLRTAPDALQAPLAATLCRLAYWRRGDLGSFYALARPLPSNRLGKRQVIYTAYDQAIDAAIEAQQLRFSSAKLLAQGALDLVELQSGAGAAALFPASLLAVLSYEEGDIDGAWDMLEARLARLRTSGTVESAVRAYPVMGRIAARRGEAQFAAVLLREGETLGERRGWRRLIATCLYERFELFLAESRWDEAQSAVDRLARVASERAERTDVNWPVNRFADLARARLGLRRAPSRDDVAMIRRLHEEAVERRDLHLGLQLAVLLVDGLTAIGQDEEALGMMTRLLTVGAGVGLCQTVLDGGPRVAAVLRRVQAMARVEVQLRPVAAYVAHLVGHWPTAPAEPVSRTSGPLSARECTVLRLISRGHSNKRIAQALGIAVDTVKTHAKNIFGKLDAANRAEAVSRAERLGLI